MCLFPRLVTNKKYLPNKKNGGVVPPFSDDRVLVVAAGCGKCIECREKKAREWRVRLTEAIKHDNNCLFVTLTFNPESLKKLTAIVLKEQKVSGYDLDDAIAKKAMRLFLERWRKKMKKSVKHWMVTEIGGTRYESLHLHGLIWSKDEQTIKEKWSYGYVYIGEYVNEKTTNYIIKYLHKIDLKHKHYKGIVLASPGIGREYTSSANARKNKFIEGKTDETYRSRQGNKMALPTYYRNKLYTEEEREKLWIEKLNKGERYILGIKVRQEDYLKEITGARKQNEEMGFGGNKKDWEEKIYEEQLRQLHQYNKMNRIEGPIKEEDIRLKIKFIDKFKTLEEYNIDWNMFQENYGFKKIEDDFEF